MNNRNFPPPSQFRGPRPEAVAYAPARILMGLIGQSEKRYMFLREAAMKLEAGFGDLGMVFEGEPIDAMTQQGLEEIFGLGNFGKQQLENLMKYELRLQGELKRFLMGRPPRRMQFPQGGPPYLGPYRPQDPQQQMMPQQQQMSPQQQMGPQQQMPPQQPQIPEMPQGPIDYRDPKQAAAALLRSQPMPLGPGGSGAPMQPQQGGAYVPPYAPGVPQTQAAYGVPPGAYIPPPSQAPVMQGTPETATQVMQQSQPVVNVSGPAGPAPQPNGAAKNATS